MEREMGRVRIAAALVAVTIAGGACGDGEVTASEPTPTETTDATPTETTDATPSDATSTETSESSATVEELYPDVIDASASLDGDGTWTFAATLSSPYDSPDRYADAWRVVGPDGTVYGVRELAHDHANEQPFTRSQTGIEIPDDVTTVTVEGRDQVSGWGGATVEVELIR